VGRVIRPILSALSSVNLSAPSGPAATYLGPLGAVGVANSVKDGESCACSSAGEIRNPRIQMRVQNRCISRFGGLSLGADYSRCGWRP
jgi:hypothetical protein